MIIDKTYVSDINLETANNINNWFRQKAENIFQLYNIFTELQIDTFNANDLDGAPIDNMEIYCEYGTYYVEVHNNKFKIHMDGRKPSGIELIERIYQ